MPITVCLVEDNARVRESLHVLIDGTSGFRCGGAYQDAETALRQIPTQKPDVILMDINLPSMSGIECVHHLRTLSPQSQVLILTVHEDDDQIFAALKAGASGYLLKRASPAELMEAISEVHKGGAPMSSSIARKVIQSFHKEPGTREALSQREEQVLHYLAKGYLYKEIAQELSISFTTVHSHVRNIYGKLHVRSRTEAVNRYLGK